VQSGGFSLVDQNQPFCYNSSSITQKGAGMNFDIEFINDTEATVDYSEQAEAEFDAGESNGIEKYTEIFESECINDEVDAEDIGGLIVYSKKGKLHSVYDYENFCGWVV
jgi:hypothetical protein